MILFYLNFIVCFLKIFNKSDIGKSLENLFVIDGIFDRNHPLECEKIQLWEVFNEGFKMTRGHANLYYYIPFPNFGICYRNSSEDNVRITLLVRSLNMNDDEAQDCYMKASTFLLRNLFLKNKSGVG